VAQTRCMAFWMIYLIEVKNCLIMSMVLSPSRLLITASPGTLRFIAVAGGGCGHGYVLY